MVFWAQAQTILASSRRNFFWHVDELLEWVDPTLGGEATRIFKRVGAAAVEILGLNIKNRLIWLYPESLFWLNFSHWLYLLILLENDIFWLEAESVLFFFFKFFGAALPTWGLLLLAFVNFILVIFIFIFSIILRKRVLVLLFLGGCFNCFLLLPSLTYFFNGHCELKFGPLSLFRPYKVELSIKWLTYEICGSQPQAHAALVNVLLKF